MKEINSAIEEIKNDRTHGASYLAHRSLEIIQEAVQMSQADNLKDFFEYMLRIARKLKECRSTMVPINNGASRFIYEVLAYFPNAVDLPSLQDFSVSSIQNIINGYEQAQDNTIEAGARIIKEQDRIMTCSYSSTVVQTMLHAHNQGRSFQVMAARSQAFPGGIAYGEKMAVELNSQGVDCLVCADDCIGAQAGQADKIIVGADCVLIDGSVLNGYPSAELARAGSEQNVPFYSLCESHKFFYQKEIESVEEGFDLIPSHLITSIVCEKGQLSPAQVYMTVKETQPYRKF